MPAQAPTFPGRIVGQVHCHDVLVTKRCCFMDQNGEWRGRTIESIERRIVAVWDGDRWLSPEDYDRFAVLQARRSRARAAKELR